MKCVTPSFQIIQIPKATRDLSFIVFVQKRYWKRHPKLNTTSSKQITQLQEEIQSLQKDDRLRGAKDSKLKIIETFSKHQTRRQNQMQLSFDSCKSAPESYERVKVQPRRPFRSNTINPNNNRLNANTTSNFISIYWSTKLKLWNWYNFKSNRN